MRELSLHILDIVTNSVEAEALRVILYIEELKKENLLRITIKDNGRGMDPETVQKVIDPFVTSRSTRSVGMGLPFWNLAAMQAGGKMEIKSEKGVGTVVYAEFQLNNLNRAPLGDIADTWVNLILGALDVHFYYLHRTDTGLMRFDSYWLLARMAEQDCSIYELVAPAKKVLKNGLVKIGSKA